MDSGLNQLETDRQREIQSQTLNETKQSGAHERETIITGTNVIRSVFDSVKTSIGGMHCIESEKGPGEGRWKMIGISEMEYLDFVSEDPKCYGLRESTAPSPYAQTFS